MRENLPDITHERAIPVNSPLISLPQAADSFSLRAKSRLRRLRSDTHLRAQPLGGRLGSYSFRFLASSSKLRFFVKKRL